jgi:hypothetical protein
MSHIGEIPSSFVAAIMASLKPKPDKRGRVALSLRDDRFASKGRRAGGALRDATREINPEGSRVSQDIRPSRVPR